MLRLNRFPKAIIASRRLNPQKELGLVQYLPNDPGQFSGYQRFHDKGALSFS